MQLPFRAIAFDVDDTLTKSKQPLTEDIGGLLSTLCALVPVAIMTGGKLEQIRKQIVERVPHITFTNIFLFPSGASSAYSFSEDGIPTPLYQHTLGEEEVAKIFEVSLSVIKDTRLIEGQMLYGDVVEARDSSVAISLLGQMAPPEIKKVFDPDQKKRLMLLPLLKEKLPDYDIKIGGLTTIDITKTGIDKAYGVKKFSEITGVTEKDILYVGDALYEGGNDAAVLKTNAKVKAVENPEDTKKFLEALLHEVTL
jgi:HAD superfamily hydrolase (TIGR01484 family)